CSTAPCPIYVGTDGGIYSSNNPTSGSVAYANLNAPSLQIASLRDGAVGPNFAASKQALGSLSWQGLAQYSGNAAWPVTVTQNPITASVSDFNTIIDPTNTQVMYAITYTPTGQQILSKTTNGGRIWGLANKGLNHYISRLIIDPANHLHLVVLMGGYIYESLNGGSSWYQGIENIP